MPEGKREAGDNTAEGSADKKNEGMLSFVHSARDKTKEFFTSSRDSARELTNNVMDSVHKGREKLSEEVNKIEISTKETLTSIRLIPEWYHQQSHDLNSNYEFASMMCRSHPQLVTTGVCLVVGIPALFIGKKAFFVSVGLAAVAAQAGIQTVNYKWKQSHPGDAAKDNNDKK